MVNYPRNSARGLTAFAKLSSENIARAHLFHTLRSNCSGVLHWTLEITAWECFEATSNARNRCSSRLLGIPQHTKTPH